MLTSAKALCLVGFPLIPMVVYLSRVHPGLPGPLAADQIAQLAAQANRWSQVHLALSISGFLGLATILILRSEVARKAPALVTNLAATIGVVGGVVFTGTVLMEVQVIPAFAKACAASAACLGPENAAFTTVLAEQGWRVLPGLTIGGRTLVLGIALLAVLGYAFGALRTWEALLLFAGSLYEFGLVTGLHQWGNFRPSSGMPGLAAVALLIGGGGVALRLLKQRKLQRDSYS